MGGATDSASGETSCDELPSIVPSANAKFSLSTLDFGKKKLVLLPGVKLEQLNTVVADSESELSSVQIDDILDVTGKSDTDTPLADVLKRAIKEETSPTADEKIIKSTGHKKVHACTFEGCALTFSRPWRLEAHIKFHNGERPFKCTVDGCSKDYTNNAHLRRHIASNHAPSKCRVKLQCPYPNCFVLLSNRTALSRHFDRKHKERVCAVCKLNFCTSAKLKEHMVVHTSAYQCETCHKHFNTKRELSRHRNRKHITYSCNYPDCDQTFEVWISLRKHYSVAHPVPKYICNDCGRAFAVKVNLRKHVETHTLKDRRTYHCTFEGCIRYYHQKSNLTAHTKSVHLGVTFPCTHKDCSWTLVSKQKLKEHMRTHFRRKVPKKPRKKSSRKRKDTGTPKRSMASRLLGVALPCNAEKTLLNARQLCSDLSDSSVSDMAALQYEPQAKRHKPISSPVPIFPLVDVQPSETSPQ